jgi:carboxylesterase
MKMFSAKPAYELAPFTDISDVDEIELSDLDYKRAETEEVKLESNYPAFFKGNDIGILIVHGFTGSPLEMAPLKDFMVEQGFSVYQARVAGHGSIPENLNLTTYKDWYESVRYGYFILKKHCRKVFIIGESMGGLVSLNAAAFNGADGVVLLAPCIKIKNFSANFAPFVRHFVKIVPKVEYGDFKKNESHIYYDKWPIEGLYQLLMFTKYAEANMHRYDMPMLGFQFTKDPVVSGQATIDFFKNAPSIDKKLVEYKDDKEVTHILASEKNKHRDEMFALIEEWIKDRS